MSGSFSTKSLGGELSDGLISQAVELVLSCLLAGLPPPRDAGIVSVSSIGSRARLSLYLFTGSGLAL